MGQGSDWVKTKVNINTTKIFLIELQRSIVVKVKLNCYIKLQWIYTFFLIESASGVVECEYVFKFLFKWGLRHGPISQSKIRKCLH